MAGMLLVAEVGWQKVEAGWRGGRDGWWWLCRGRLTMLHGGEV